ncbi:MAG: MFS transporter, partial [Candidatus Dormibacteraeota bacterium]|nr:MFS transporter [Candidatus Dormibacteraeota bacterium]
FIMSALGAFFGVWLGLVLTTPPTPFPLGVPFAVAGPGFDTGWRVMYIIGAVLALVGVLLRFQIPESPRWLISRGRIEDAHRVVDAMEARAARRGTLPAPDSSVQVEVTTAPRISYLDILGSQLYLRRTGLLLAVWFTGYMTVYAYAVGLTVALVTLGYPAPEAGLIVAVGTLGFIACAVFAFIWGELLERKHWLPVAAAITVVGAIILGLAAHNLAVAFIGSLVIFFGFNVWVPMTYSWSTESFPTRARTSGFALVDGVGHLGGGVGQLVVAPLIPVLGPLSSMLLISAFLVISSGIAQLGTGTRNKRLDFLSP